MQTKFFGKVSYMSPESRRASLINHQPFRRKEEKGTQIRTKILKRELPFKKMKEKPNQEKIICTFKI